jgi:hypothetical protein
MLSYKYNLLLILVTSFFIWYFSFSAIQRSFKRVLDWLLYQMGTPLVEAQLEILAKAELTTPQIIELLINRHGAQFLLLLISVILTTHIFYKTIVKKYKVQMLFVYAIQFLVALTISAFELFGYSPEYELNLTRMLRFSLLIGTIFSGVVIYNLINKNKTLHATIALIVTVTVIVTLSMGSVYWSPRVINFNHQVTHMEIVGTAWFEKSKSLDVPVIANSAKALRRFENYILGVDYPSSVKARIDHSRLPSHFGYNINNSIAETLNFQDRYIIIFELDKVAPLFYPENVRSKIHQFSKEDFVKLSYDSATSRLYTNGEFEIWRVHEISE